MADGNPTSTPRATPFGDSVASIEGPLTPRGVSDRPDLFDLSIPIKPSAVRRLGLAGAAITQQIRYWAERHGSDWFVASYADLERLTGIAGRAIRHAVAKLIEAGAIERVRRINGFGETRPAYRVLVDDNGERVAPDDAPPLADQGDNPVTPTYLQTREDNQEPPYIPPRGEEEEDQPVQADQQSLFESPSAPPTRSDKAKLGRSEAFESFWRGYPKLYGREGDKQSARRAWAAAMKNHEGATVVELARSLDHYVAARERYAEIWCGTQAPLMNASTFIRRKWSLFLHERSDTELRYWPAPEGESWNFTALDRRALIEWEERLGVA